MVRLQQFSLETSKLNGTPRLRIKHKSYLPPVHLVRSTLFRGIGRTELRSKTRARPSHKEKGFHQFTVSSHPVSSTLRRRKVITKNTRGRKNHRKRWIKRGQREELKKKVRGPPTPSLAARPPASPILENAKYVRYFAIA